MGTACLEMVVPRMTTRVEQGFDSTCQRVDTGEVRPLVEVALRARQGKILFVVPPTMLLCDDVLDLIRDEGLIGLAGVAIFAAVARSLADTLPRGGTFHADCPAFKTERALACKTEMRLIPLTSD